MESLYAIYKEEGRFCLLSTKELPTSKAVNLHNKNFYLIEEDSLDFVFQILNQSSIIFSDSLFIQSYGNRLKKIGIKIIDTNKFLFIPAKFVLSFYEENELRELFFIAEKKQKISLEKLIELVTYTDRFFSYLGSSQQMFQHVLINIVDFFNNNIYLFNSHLIKNRPLIKNAPQGTSLNFLDKEVFFKLFYMTALFEGWIESNSIEFSDPFLNKMLGKQSEYSFLVPFDWIRTFKNEIYNIELKNNIIIAPRIYFKINKLSAISGIILKDRLQELYIKQQIISYLLNIYKNDFYTLNLNNYIFYSPKKINNHHLRYVELT